jgi:hypothetical protein
LRYSARKNCRVRCRARYKHDTRERANELNFPRATSSLRRSVSLPASFSLPPTLRLRTDAPPPRRRPSSGYHGVRARPSGRFDAEIRSGDERIHLGTFDTAHEAARAYDAVAWRLGRSRRTMNFHDVWTRKQAEALALPSPAITRE